MGLRPTAENRARSAKTEPTKHMTPAKTFTPVKLPFSCDIIAPPIGLVVRAPTDITAKSRPCRMPILWIGEIWATSAGPKEMKAPEANPKNPAKRISATLLDAGIHKAKTRIAVRNETKTKTLYRPSLSERIPGTIRPNKLGNKDVSIHLVVWIRTLKRRRTHTWLRSIWALGSRLGSATSLPLWPEQ